MAKKPIFPLYPLNSAQSTVELQERYALKKCVDNIPFLFTFRHEMDFDILEQALDIEIRRNDCLRSFGYREKGALKTYFLPEWHYGKVPRVDFRGKTAEYQQNYLQRLSNTPFDYYKKGNFRVVFGYNTEGKCIMYFAQHHIFNDTFGVMIAVDDLLKVYLSLKDGTELPPALGSFEEYQKEIPSLETEEAKMKGDAYFKKYISSFPEPAAIAPFSARFLDDYRAKKKDPTVRHAPTVALLRNTAKLKKFVITGEEADRIFRFCTEHNISPQSLVYMITKLQRMLINHGETCTYDMYSCANRVKKQEKHMSGCVVNAFPMVTAYPDETIISDALTDCQRTFMKHYRYRHYGTTYSNNIIRQLYSYPPLNGYLMGATSVVPMKMDLPDEVSCFMEWIPPQSQATPLFTVVGLVPDESYIVWYQTYLTKFAKAEEIEAMLVNYKKLFGIIVDNPDATLAEIINRVK